MDNDSFDVSYQLGFLKVLKLLDVSMKYDF